MTGQEPIPAPTFQVVRSPVTSKRPAGRRFLLIAIAVSVAAHIAAALLIMFLPRVLPRQARSQQQGTVELLMVEQKGGKPSQAGQPQDNPPAPPRPEQKTEVPKAEVQKAETPSAPAKAVPTPPVTKDAEEPAPPPMQQSPASAPKAQDKPDAKPAQVQPARPQSQEAPVFDLAGTESESNAVVLGGRVLPAMPDNRFRNRPPIYPHDAEIRGEHGTVVVLIHVSEAGVAVGVDVVQSSGVDSLDQAAINAVRRWHFRPALQEGSAVPFDMPFRFVFEPY